VFLNVIIVLISYGYCNFSLVYNLLHFLLLSLFFIFNAIFNTIFSPSWRVPVYSVLLQELVNFAHILQTFWWPRAIWRDDEARWCRTVSSASWQWADTSSCPVAFTSRLSAEARWRSLCKFLLVYLLVFVYSIFIPVVCPVGVMIHPICLYLFNIFN